MNTISLAARNYEAAQLSQKLVSLGYNLKLPRRQQRFSPSNKKQATKVYNLLLKMGYDAAGNNIGSPESMAYFLNIHGHSGVTPKDGDEKLKAMLAANGIDENGNKLSSKKALKDVIKAKCDKKTLTCLASTEAMVKECVTFSTGRLGQNLYDEDAPAKTLAAITGEPNPVLMKEKDKTIAKLNELGYDEFGNKLGSHSACATALKKVRPFEQFENTDIPTIHEDKAAIIKRLHELGYDRNGYRPVSVEALKCILRMETGSPVADNMTKRELILAVQKFGYDYLGNKMDGDDPRYDDVENIDEHGNPIGSKASLLDISKQYVPEKVPTFENMESEDIWNNLIDNGVDPESGYALGSKKQMINVIKRKRLFIHTEDPEQEVNEFQIQSAPIDEMECMKKVDIRKRLNMAGLDHEGNPFFTYQSIKAITRKYVPDAQQVIASKADYTTLKIKLHRVGRDECGFRIGSHKSVLASIKKTGIQTKASPEQLTREQTKTILAEHGYDELGNRLNSREHIRDFLLTSRSQISFGDAASMNKHELMVKYQVKDTDIMIPVSGKGGAESLKLLPDEPIATLIEGVSKKFPDPEFQPHYQKAQAAMQAQWVINVADVQRLKDSDWEKMKISIAVKNRILACC